MPSDENISLKEFITALVDERDRRYEQRFIAIEKATTAAFKAAENALAKAEAASIRDKAQANEWRDAMNDREKNFVARPEFNAELHTLETRVDSLTGTRGAGLNAAWGYFIGAIGVAAAVVTAAAALFMHR